MWTARWSTPTICTPSLGGKRSPRRATTCRWRRSTVVLDAEDAIEEATSAADLVQVALGKAGIAPEQAVGKLNARYGD
jgi:hypothetical protein